MSTRRSHIVRIGTDTNRFVDIEVLDAIATRTTEGKQVVLVFPGADAIPYIVDDTGDGNGKSVVGATRRSHMKRISSSSDSTQFFDIEVLDAISFKIEGKEWIMNFPDDGGLSVYNTTTNSGSPTGSTRIVHDEKIYSDPTDKTSDFMLVERCDTMTLRTINGEQWIITMPSSDDGSGTGRADTDTKPAGYVAGTTVPPQNSDPSVYAFFPSASKGAITGKNGKITMGPLWWPRATSKKSGPWYTYTPIQQPYEWSLYENEGEYVWVKDPALSSFASTPATLTWQRLPNVGVGYNNGPADSFGLHHIGPALPPIGFASLDDVITNGHIGVDWGVLDFTDSRIDAGASDGLNKNYCVPGVSGSPDTWQLAGIPAPALIPPPTPTDKWTAGAQSAAIQKQCAMAYLAAWNGTSNAWNEEMVGAAITLTNLFWYITWPDSGETQRFGNGNIPATYDYPSTAFGVPLPNQLVNPPADGGTFLGGLPGDFWIGHWGVFPAPYPFAPIIAVEQLDPTKWDTTDAYAPKLRPSSS
jgi:hypothetical protein